MLRKRCVGKRIPFVYSADRLEQTGGLQEVGGKTEHFKEKVNSGAADPGNLEKTFFIENLNL